MAVEPTDGIRFKFIAPEDLSDPFNNQPEWPRLSCPQADQLALEFGDLRVDGNVSIGNTTSTDKSLDVNGNITATSFLGNGATLDGIVKKAGDTMTGALTIDNNLTVNNELQAAKLQIVREGWTYLDIRCFKEGEDAVIRLFDDEHYWSIHNDDSEGNKLDIRSNNSSKMSLTPEGNLTIDNSLTVGNGIQTANLQIVREGWTYLDIRCFKEGEDAVIRLFDDEHYWSIHNDDSKGNKLDIRSNNSSKMSLTPEGNLDVTGIIKAKSYKTSIYKAGGIDSGQISLSNSNRWADFPNLSITFSLSEPATVIAFYKISMNAPNSSHLVTRLLVNNRDVSRTIVGNTYYWGNSDFWSDELSEGTHSIQVQYRTPGGGINNPAGTDWNNRVLRVMVLGS